MTDDEVLDKIAQVWVDNGGDEVGFLYTFYDIANRINGLIKQKSKGPDEGEIK